MPSSSTPSFLCAVAAGVVAWAAPGVAQAQTPHPHAYGILVGTNVGGAGQQPLRYAEDDARRMADVLKQLGRYGDTDLRVLVRPDGAKVFAAIDEVTAKIRADQAKGEQAVFVFYYSGHARASSFSLGGEELAIAAVREKLSKVPSTMTLVVLDACQSGQFARIKGGEPAADFSFNSVSRLTTKGIAVMASSTAQELSQESDELRSSYFTHHLVVGLRGAADGDGDGRVSLDEALSLCVPPHARVDVTDTGRRTARHARDRSRRARRRSRDLSGRCEVTARAAGRARGEGPRAAQAERQRRRRGAEGEGRAASSRVRRRPVRSDRARRVDRDARGARLEVQALALGRSRHAARHERVRERSARRARKGRRGGRRGPRSDG